MVRTVLGVVLLLAPTAALADDEGRGRLRYDPWLDGTIVSVGAALVVANGLFEGDIAPSSCRWCDRNADGSDSLNAFDRTARGLRLEDPRLVRKWGDLAIWRFLPQTTFGLFALVAAHEGRPGDGLVDDLVLLETTLIAALGTQLVRYTTARERPYVHAYTPEERAEKNLSADARSSFFSGHASVSFAMAVSAGTVASMHRYRWAPVIWVAGLALASLAAYSRIAADLHYTTDVLTGMLFGSAVGFAVPYFLHPPASSARER